MSRRPRRFSLPAIWVVLVGVASVTPVPALSGPVTGSGPPILLAAHLVGYAVLAALLIRADVPPWTAVVATATVGLGIEGLQSLLAYRSASAVDAGVNLVGALLGAFLMRLRRRN